MSGSQTAGRQMAPGGRLEILERDLKKKKKINFTCMEVGIVNLWTVMYIKMRNIHK